MRRVLGVMVLIGIVLSGTMVRAAEYTLELLPVVGWSEYRVAEVKGFWGKQGVTIKIVDYVWPSEGARAGAQRRGDITPLPMTNLVSVQDGGASDAVYLGTLSIADLHKYLIIKKDLVGKSLKGVTIGNFLPCPANDYFIEEYLKSVNTGFADIRQVGMNPDGLQANFTQGRLQSILTYYDQNNPFYEKANGVIAFSTENFYEPHGLGIIRPGRKNAIPREDLKKILRGTVEAIEWMREPANWEEYKKILKQYCLPSNTPELTDDQYRALTRDHKFVDPKTLLEQNQQPLRDLFTQYRAFLVANKSVKPEILEAFTYENTVYNEVLIEVLQEFITQ